jgi:hypothetical protein
MTEMVYMNVRVNALSGSLPPEWAAGMVKLREFYANLNNLSGIIPSSWGTDMSLESVNLQNNYLSGTLPLSWFTGTIRLLKLNYNRIEGNIDVIWF